MEKKSGFYGGKIGVWLPVLFMLVGMLVSTIIGGGGLARLTGITFFALALGFLLAKDKKNYGKITLKGLQNPMLGTIIMAYIMAGMLATPTAKRFDRCPDLGYHPSGLERRMDTHDRIPDLRAHLHLLRHLHRFGGRCRAGAAAAGPRFGHQHGLDVRRYHLRCYLRR